VRGLSLDLFFDFLGVRLNGDKAEGRSISVNWRFTDTGQRYLLTLENCALTYLSERQGEGADATVELARATLNRLILRELTLSEAIADGRIIISGQATKVAELFALFDDFTMDFEVVEPLRGRG
jgi:alkyl sulfatase BDS1-like metallo-beta-lactamase superfamily hydrolase